MLCCAPATALGIDPRRTALDGSLSRLVRPPGGSATLFGEVNPVICREVWEGPLDWFWAASGSLSPEPLLRHDWASGCSLPKKAPSKAGDDVAKALGCAAEIDEYASMANEGGR